ncbi:hypothetical protein KC622_02615 [Candidatus Dojkabacteria bacterium]|uniref:Uncharacterized protein n=1 Tax=Candidatus Dojkabacteria bacterium TaxID=2099670 RepID=A0A955KVR6_9BACT|nr:hypothetical protein [Candidatus Dojkabacteria bacterium]MCB9790548.1 hypothetical protein [Candidatus Nomurabacteria bacterium]
MITTKQAQQFSVDLPPTEMGRCTPLDPLIFYGFVGECLLWNPQGAGVLNVIHRMPTGIAALELNGPFFPLRLQGWPYQRRSWVNFSDYAGTLQKSPLSVPEKDSGTLDPSQQALLLAAECLVPTEQVRSLLKISRIVYSPPLEFVIGPTTSEEAREEGWVVLNPFNRKVQNAFPRLAVLVEAGGNGLLEYIETVANQSVSLTVCPN